MTDRETLLDLVARAEAIKHERDEMVRNLMLSVLVEMLRQWKPRDPPQLALVLPYSPNPESEL